MVCRSPEKCNAAEFLAGEDSAPQRRQMFPVEVKHDSFRSESIVVSVAGRVPRLYFDDEWMRFYHAT
jgi:hypothetical protein